MARPSRFLPALLISISTAWLALAAETGAGKPPAPWDGSRREDVIALIGEPLKAKKRPGGGETLTYRLVRLGPGEVPVPGQRLVDVPGIGPCATPGAPDPALKESVSFEPISVDDKGRPASGGYTTTRSKSVTWKKGQREPDAEPAQGAIGGGKVTLKLDLDAAGRVAGWSVSPRPDSR